VLLLEIEKHPNLGDNELTETFALTIADRQKTSQLLMGCCSAVLLLKHAGRTVMSPKTCSTLSRVHSGAQWRGMNGFKLQTLSHSVCPSWHLSVQPPVCDKRLSVSEPWVVDTILMVTNLRFQRLQPQPATKYSCQPVGQHHSTSKLTLMCFCSFHDYTPVICTAEHDLK
jgi:hypothetical protein